MAKRGVNKVILLGNLGQDPETRTLGNGDAVTNVRLATSEVWNDRQTGEQKQKTEWHRVIFWRKPAEIIAQYCRKGDQLYVEGKLETRKWQDQAGVEHYTTEIIAEDFQLMGGRRSDDRPQQGAAPQAGQSHQQPPSGPANFKDFDDDVPF